MLRLFQLARRELPITLLYKWPFLIPRFLRPAAVSPRSSRCLWTDLQIQLILGSRRTALWNGSTIKTSKYLNVESSATQYELSTRRLPQYRPARSCKKEVQISHYSCTSKVFSSGNRENSINRVMHSVNLFISKFSLLCPILSWTIWAHEASQISSTPP